MVKPAVRRPNLRQVEAFRAVMLTGSATAGAAFMGVTQPAVSKLLRDFQHHLKLKLFERRGTGIAPTAEAVTLFGEVERSFIGIERIAEAAEQIRLRQASLLRIAALPALANGFLPRFAGKFVSGRPELDLEVSGVISTLVVDWVVNRQCDLGFASPQIDHPAVQKIAMPSLPYVAVVPEDHKLARKNSLAPKDFEGENFISLNHSSQSRRYVDAIFAEAGVSRVMRVETHLSEIVCGLVSSGLGVGICDPFTAREFARRGVVARPFRPVVTIEIFAIYSSHQAPTAISLEFAEQFAAHIRKFDRENRRA
ncbi:MAG: LysR family transcriptional regulator [Proteobacteria bacterium]|nr:LysR family transcriptional regulator [Pseudomonadota bacterium]